MAQKLIESGFDEARWKAARPVVFNTENIEDWLAALA
jgi:hypothetical protein